MKIWQICFYRVLTPVWLNSFMRFSNNDIFCSSIIFTPIENLSQFSPLLLILSPLLSCSVAPCLRRWYGPKRVLCLLDFAVLPWIMSMPGACASSRPYSPQILMVTLSFLLFPLLWGPCAKQTQDLSSNTQKTPQSPSLFSLRPIIISQWGPAGTGTKEPLGPGNDSLSSP